jgi:hypothetical protein
MGWRAGRRRSAAAPLAAALVGAACALCAGCSGSGASAGLPAPSARATGSHAPAPAPSASPQPPAKVAAGAASGDPCLILTQAAADAVLGPPASPPSLAVGMCTTTGPAGVVDLTVALESFGPDEIPVTISNPAPVAGLGHYAVCGPSSGGSGGFVSYTFIGSIDPDYSMEIDGPSCAVDRRLAVIAYDRL